MPSVKVTSGQIWLKEQGNQGTAWSCVVSGIPSGAKVSSATLAFAAGNTYNPPGHVFVYAGTSTSGTRLWNYTGSGGGNSYSVDVSSYVTGNGTFPFYFYKSGNSSSKNYQYFSDIAVTIEYTIPASTFTLSKTTLDAGDNLAVTISRQNTSYTHSVIFSFGSRSNTVQNVATSASYTIPIEWLDQIPTSVSGTGTVTVQTFNGSTLVGTSTKSFTLTCPASVVPTVGTITIEPINSKWGLYVQNISQAKISVTDNAAGTGANVTGVTISGNGYSASSDTLTMTYLKNAGKITVTATVTDSRNRTGTKTAEFTVTAYTPVSITDATCVRCDSEGNTAPTEGTSAKTCCTYTYSAIGENAVDVRLAWRTQTSDWTEILNYPDASGSEQIVMQDALPVSVQYEFRFTVADAFSNTEQTIQVSSGQVFMRWDKTKQAIGFGCYPQGTKRVELADWELVVGGTNVGDKLSVVTPVCNQLDNSNFANPVNQRGQSFYNTAGSYCIDRWIVASLDSQGVANVGSGYVALCNTTNDYVDLQQILPNASGLKGLDMTFAVKMNGSDDPFILNFTFGTYKHATFVDDKIALIHWNEDRVIIRAQNTGETWYGFTWAALYVGTFTVDTLPYYVPRGYVDEYHECCRYYYQVPGSSIYAYPGYFSSSTLARITINTPMRMRIVPSVNVETVANCVMFSGSSSFTPTDVSVLGRQLDAVCLGFTVSGATSWTACNARFNTTISLSADL